MKKLVIGLMTFLLCFSHAVSSKEWSDKEKKLFTAYTILTAVDVLQTRAALRDPCGCYAEGNPLLLSEHPSDAQLLFWGSVSVYAYHRLIEKDAPDWMLYTSVGIRTAIVVKNDSIGVNIKYAF